MQLTDDIYNYYYTRAEILGKDKTFHFATRTAAWIGKPGSFTLLRHLKPFITNPEQPIAQTIADIFYALPTGRRNAHELRQPFFDKYPDLYGAHMALFRVRHLQEVYGIDAREALFTVIPKATLLELEKQLLADDDAMKTLSTFAINYCYLLERVVCKDFTSLPIQHLFELGTSYDTTTKEQVQLLIYFYTHCIIGESNFYTKTIPEDFLPLYKEMLAILEPLIKERFSDINLDNKLEFLVCARICEYETALFEQIYAECERSISDQGTFLIDRHNTNIQGDRNDFIKSEHRNVLFIMSTSPYNPHSTLVS